MSNTYYVYILTNKRNTVLYTGMTNDLARRVEQHKSHLVKGFAKRYNVDKLLYYETYSDVQEAITREKQIKAGNRKRKIMLVESINAEWKDLVEELL